MWNEDLILKIARGCQTAETSENIITISRGNVIKSNGQYDCTTSIYVFTPSCVFFFFFLFAEGKV